MLHVGLAVVTLGTACTLMGGTLPLAAKCVETSDDDQRGSTGLLYGANAFGGLLGVVASTFFLLEALGSRGTLYLATALNALVAAVAFAAASRGFTATGVDPPSRGTPAIAPQGHGAAPVFVYAAAFVTGFVFFLCEIVWYRMSAPLLGGSVYGFGIILALALGGIALGGALYRSVLAPRAGAVHASTFALLTALQALLLAAPYAFGDRIAPLAFHANELRQHGFAWQVVGWTGLASLMVPLPSVLAGMQFPLLVGLLGRGREEVGRQLGLALAANTAGAISGSLAAGFVLIPMLTAPGCWRLATWLTLGLAASAFAVCAANASAVASRRVLIPAAMAGIAALWLSLAADGPTAAWRHTPFGYGRVSALPESANGLREWTRQARWQTRREFDGRESSVALVASDDSSFVIGGKSDGSAIGDAPTQIMGGMLGALLHPSPQSALVIGLGTGSSAGWLADVPGMKRVDVVEIEPRIVELARDEFALVNRGVVGKPNVHVLIGDAREVLSVAGPSYDVVFSEPSNPYRAGIASLYTREFYQAALTRMNPGGIFSQWVHGYEIDAATLRTVYATLSSVFPYVETWVTQPNDLLFVCHTTGPTYSPDSIRDRIAVEPYSEALRRAWLTDSPYGVLARHLASAGFARRLVQPSSVVNTDDGNALEYGFARASVGREPVGVVNELLAASVAAQEDRPSHLSGQIDAARIADERMLMLAADNAAFQPPADLAGAAGARAAAIAAYLSGNHTAVLRLWNGPADATMERLILLEAATNAGDAAQAQPLVEWARRDWPVEAEFGAAVSAARHGDRDAAVEHLRVGFERYRQHPWVRKRVARQALSLTLYLASQAPADATATLFDALSEPFALHVNDEERLVTMVEVSTRLAPAFRVRAADAWGALSPWTSGFLRFRRDAYAAGGDPRVALATADLEEFEALEAPAPGDPAGAEAAGAPAPR